MYYKYEQFKTNYIHLIENNEYNFIIFIDIFTLLWFFSFNSRNIFVIVELFTHNVQFCIR